MAVFGRTADSEVHAVRGPIAGAVFGVAIISFIVLLFTCSSRYRRILHRELTFRDKFRYVLFGIQPPDTPEIPLGEVSAQQAISRASTFNQSLPVYEPRTHPPPIYSPQSNISPINEVDEPRVGATQN